MHQPSIIMEYDDEQEIAEIGECLKVKAHLLHTNLALASTLTQTISTQLILLDQQLPSNLEHYMNTNTSHKALHQYITKLQFEEIQNINGIQYQAIELKATIQQSNSDEQIKKVIPNEIDNNFNPNLSYISSKVDTDSLQSGNRIPFRLNKWSDKSKDILFQDKQYHLEQESQNSKNNTITIKKSEDPQFFQQLKNARVASPILIQAKGSGITPEPYRSKSKSPEISQRDNQYTKLPDHFKQLLNEGQRKPNVKPFENTKYSAAQIKVITNLSKSPSNKINQNILGEKQPSFQQLTPKLNQYQSQKQFEVDKQNQKFFEQLKSQNSNMKEQFSFKPTQNGYNCNPKKINEQIVESQSLRGISPQNRSGNFQIHQPPIPQNQQPIQIKLDIKQFMNKNNRSISPKFPKKK